MKTTERVRALLACFERGSQLRPVDDPASSKRHRDDTNERQDPAARKVDAAFNLLPSRPAQGACWNLTLSRLIRMSSLGRTRVGRAPNWVAVFCVCVATVGPAIPVGADEQSDGTQWLTTGRGKPGEPIHVSVEQSQSSVQVFVSLPGIYATAMVAPNQKTYTQLEAVGGGATAEEFGQPEMPFKAFFLEIPASAEVNVEIQDAKQVSLGEGFVIRPLQRPEPDADANAEDPKDEQPVFEVDEDAYQKDGVFPPSPVVLGEPGIIRGRHVVFVQVFPLQYNPAKGTLSAFETLTFSVHYKGDQGLGDQDQDGDDRRRRLATTESESMAATLVLNHRPLDLWRPEYKLAPRGADYLVIVADEFIEEIQPLVEWKQLKGFITRVVKMSDVGTTKHDVKNYIQNVYDSWFWPPYYVLLVGDADDIPPHDYTGYKPCISDHPYACVDGADIYPDLMIGRISVQTEAECTNAIDKIVRYDRTPDMGMWYDDVVIAAYYQDTDWWNPTADGVANRWFMETAMNVEEFLRVDHGMTTHMALCRSGNWTGTFYYRGDSYPHRPTWPDPVPASVVSAWTAAATASGNITTAINNGVGLAYHRDHGEELGWSDPPFYVTEVNALTNGVKTPVVLSINCLTGKFDYVGGDCFCEALLKHGSGGAVGVMGATRVSYSGHNDLFTNGIMTCFWPNYDTTHTDATYAHSLRPAEAMAYGKYYMMLYEGTGSYTPAQFHMYHWFGDPEMMMRNRRPLIFEVAHTLAAAPGVPKDIIVEVTRAGLPISDARVAISRPSGSVQSRRLTGPDGIVTFSDINLTQEGDYSLVVTARNHVPYEGVIHVIGEARLSVSPTSHDFGNVVPGSPEEVEITIANEGGLDLEIAGIALTGSAPPEPGGVYVLSSFSLDTGGGANPAGSSSPTIPGGETRTVVVTVDPRVLTGNLSDTLTVTPADSSIAPATVDLEGRVNALRPMDPVFRPFEWPSELVTPIPDLDPGPIDPPPDRDAPFELPEMLLPQPCGSSIPMPFMATLCMIGLGGLSSGKRRRPDR